ncbi:MAG TPA: hypothetical protein DCK87_02230 [Desulfotomaculum sp.]|nr:hypothetical protein [Desulfotomaculum sp.]
MSKIENKRIGTKEIIREISHRMGCRGKDVRELMDHFVDIIVENVTNGKKVQFTHLGVFSLRANKIRIRFRQSSTITRKIENNNGAKQPENDPVNNQQVS